MSKQVRTAIHIVRHFGDGIRRIDTYTEPRYNLAPSVSRLVSYDDWPMVRGTLEKACMGGAIIRKSNSVIQYEEWE